MLEHYFSQNGLTACCTDTAITLFWEKPAAAGAAEVYTVLQNDTAAGTAIKTHFTLEHLHPETEYTLFVQWRGHRRADRPHHTHQAPLRCDRRSLLRHG